MNNFRQPQQQQQTIQIDLNTLKTVPCECGNTVFDPLVQFRILPAIQSPNGQEQPLSIQMVKCIVCGTIYTLEELIKFNKDKTAVIPN